MKAHVGGVEKVYRTQINFENQSARNPEIERLWAFATIENLQSKLDYFGTDSDTEQAITDIAVEYGLVTNYTSMIVVEEEVFNALNIDRNNKQRVETEHKAREQRTAQDVANNRVDQQQPMFNSKRPSTSGKGGGALNSFWIFALLILLFVRKTRFTKQ
jgi:Ca-activated chloride channel family protein